MSEGRRRFSERYGHRAVQRVIQVDDVDDALRTRLWNVMVNHVFGGPNDDASLLAPLRPGMRIYPLAATIYEEYLGAALDDLPLYISGFQQDLRRHWMKAPWWEVYDLLEETVDAFQGTRERQMFVHALNTALEKGLSGFRVVSGELVPMTSGAEIAAVETALEEARPLVGVHTHLQTALRFLGAKPDPEYRNSIKESISAVESLCLLLTGERGKGGFTAALRLLATRTTIHPALQGAFEKLYGYTSDADGIRHALLDESDLGVEDALYMLVSCSAFVSYVMAKAAKAGLLDQTTGD